MSGAINTTKKLWTGKKIMDEKLPAIKNTIDKLKKAVAMYENDMLDEFSLKHILQEATMIFNHAALTGKVRNFNHG